VAPPASTVAVEHFAYTCLTRKLAATNSVVRCTTDGLPGRPRAPPAFA
jgi:hypothetical protein